MKSVVDNIVLILRAFIGALLGVMFSFLLFVPLIYLADVVIPFSMILVIGGTITLMAAVAAMRWGDRFLLWFMQAFKMFKYW